MKHLRIVIILFFLSFSMVYASFFSNPSSVNINESDCIKGQKTGQSFMFTRPVYQNIAAQRSLMHIFTNCTQGDYGGTGEVVPLFFEAMKDGEFNRKAARYFFFNYQQTLLVQGDDLPNGAPLRDVRAEWFGLSSNYNGTITIKPRQRQFGVWIEYQQDVNRFIDWELLENAFVSIAFPIQYIQNNLHLTEDVVSSSTTSLKTMKEALQRPELKYGKIGGSKSKVGLAEIMIKAGAYFLRRKGFEIYLYSHLVIPTAKSQNMEFIFDPFLGYNGHICWGSGGNIQLPLNDNTDDYIVAFFFGAENVAAFSNHQKRVFDIRFKPWSRYLLLNSDHGEINVSATQVFTRDVTVHPRNFVDIATGFRWYTDTFELELGYSLWAHGRETIHFHNDCFDQKWGIAGVGTMVNDMGITVGRTASKSAIDFQAPDDVNPCTGDPIFVPIQIFNLNFKSNASRSTLSHRVYLAGGYCIEPACGPQGFLGLGCYADLPSDNASLAGWGFWLKAGISL